ncbi:uncharacterized protein LOC124888949 [Capsicum annuum]|uniref:uncharacterized protein LOC124888949 n=1 Tax=Capsicum annuum TaxID=4072 RepID=UPI001FB07ABC|nr:uncharacterized protein LOC124888949 [Capsicum annuum]
MKKGDTVKEYAAKLLEIVNKIRLFGETFLDSKVAEKMMISLPARFESKISAIEEPCDLKTLSISELISKLQAPEQITSIRDEEVEKVAFQTNHKGKQPMKDNRRMEGDKIAKRKPWIESSQKEKFPPCIHYSGCTSHMSYNELMFHTLDKSLKAKVGMGNGAKLEAHGKGSVFFQTNQDTLIDKVEMVDRIFPVDEKFDNVNFVRLDDSWLWHRRYGHFNYATLRSMYEKGLTKDLPKISLSKEVCGSCKMGKAHRKAFPKSAT